MLGVTDGRTEPATPRKRREARRKGHVARSAELGQAVSLVLAALLLPATLTRAAAALGAEWQSVADVGATLDISLPRTA